MIQGTEEEVSAEWCQDEAACLEVGAPEMPELSVTNDPLSFVFQYYLLKHELEWSDTGFSMLLFLPPIISPTLPHKHQEKPDLLIRKISFFPPNLRLAKREGPGKKIRS